jgi:acyl-coenzyme A synthetase/AMP-(fatty) acid ligase
MDVLGDLVARDRRSDRPALRVDGRESYSYHDLCTTAWKAGNVLRHYGVAGGHTVAVAALARPAPLLTFLGAASLGAVTRFGPSPGTAGDGEVDARVVLVPAVEESAYDLPPGSKLFVYGDRPADPSTVHWEADVWSENPAIPPYEVAAEDPALAAADGSTHSHRDLLDAAGEVVEAYELDADSRVGLRGPLEHPGVVAAGVVAPLLAGGTVVVPAESGDGGDAAEPVDLAVVGADGSGSATGGVVDADTAAAAAVLRPGDVLG